MKNFMSNGGYCATNEVTEHSTDFIELYFSPDDKEVFVGICNLLGVNPDNVKKLIIPIQDYFYSESK